MKITNKCGNGLLDGQTFLKSGATADIPDEIAKKWLKIKGVEKYTAPEDVKKAAEKAKKEAEKEIAALKAEIEKLKKEAEAVKKAAEKAKKEAEKDNKSN